MTEIYFLTAGRLEVRDQGATRVGLWRDLSSWLVDGWLLAVFLHSKGQGALWCLCLFPGDQGPTLVISLNLDYLPKCPIPNKITLGARTST